MAQRQALLKIIRLVSIADATGAPIETYTREKLLLNLDNYLQKFPRRSSPHDIGLQPGEYSDDTQQSLSVGRYLLRLSLNPYTPFNFDIFMLDLLNVYDEDAHEKGVNRGGHGGFEKIATYKGDRIQLQKDMNMKFYKESSNILANNLNIGNGSGMRLNPFMIFDFPNEVLTEHLIGMTLSTHNNAVAVIGNILMVNVLKALYENKVNPEDIIKYSIGWFIESQDYKYFTTNLQETKDIFNRLTKSMPCINDFDAVVEYYTGYLVILNELPKCNNDLRNINHLDISFSHSTLCVKNGGTGLPTYALPTIGWFHYLISNLSSCQSSLEILKRCLLVGGDVDTIAAYTYPISHIVLCRNLKKNDELPEYIMNQLLESDIDLLDRRLG